MERKNLNIQIPLETFQPHKWHLEVLKSFDDKIARFFLLVWHRRSRKTTLLLNLLIRECIKNPKKVYGYISPTYVQSKNIVWRDPNMLDRYLPKEMIKRRNESELYIEFINGSILKILGADKPEAIKGMDVEGIGIDEWSLVKREIWEETLRPIITQSNERWAMFAFTPKGMNHAHEYYIKSKEWSEWYSSMLKGSESGLLPEEELKQAKIEMTDALYNQEIECSFLARDERSFITGEMLEALKGVHLFFAEVKKIISCDPSEGGDECVIYAIENGKAIEAKYLHENDSMKVAGEMIAMGYKNNIKNFAVDNIGIGKGIEDRLREQGHNIIGVRSSEKAHEEKRFYNKRTEMWWYVSNLIRQKEIPAIEDNELKTQLVAPKYEVIDSNGKIRLEPKRYTKELLGRSPDRGDAFVMGLYAMQFINAENAPPKQFYKPMPMKYHPSVYGRKYARV